MWRIHQRLYNYFEIMIQMIQALILSDIKTSAFSLSIKVMLLDVNKEIMMIRLYTVTNFYNIFLFKYTEEKNFHIQDFELSFISIGKLLLRSS